MQNWLIYLPVAASLAALGGAYAFLKTGAKQLQKHRAAVLQSMQDTLLEPEKVHEALKPVETALEKAVRDIMVGVEESHRAAVEAEARPYA